MVVDKAESNYQAEKDRYEGGISTPLILSWPAKYGKYDYGYYADDKGQLELIDDVARYKYGKGWRLPTYEEFIELKNSCDWSSYNSCGVDGCLVTSKINGKSIFIPVAGHYEDSIINNSNKELYYYSSTLWSRHGYVSGININDISSFNQTYALSNYCYRQYGHPIRPVCDKQVLMYNVQVLSKHGAVSGSGQYSEGSVAQLSATTDDSCYVFVRWSDGNIDNPRKLAVTQDTTLTAEFEQIKYNITLDSDAEKGEVVEEK